MKKLTSLFILIILANAAFSQVAVDSVQQKLTNVKLPELPDSLKTTWNKVDSIRNNFNNSADSLNRKYQQALSPLYTEQNNISRTIDSLTNINQPVESLNHKLDSINQKKVALQTDLNSKLDNIKSKTIGKLEKIEMTPEMQGPVKEFTGKINDFNISDQGLAHIPPVEIPGYSLPEIKGIEKLSNLPKLETPLGSLGDLGQQVEGLGGDLKSISQGNLTDLNQLPQTLEAQAGNVEGLDKLQESSQIIDGYEDQLANLNNVDGLKQEGADLVQKEAINHFAGKEKELQAAMEQLGKYKRKFGSIKSLKDLPQRAPNPMKGKPFIERLVPGMWLQFHVKDYWLVDLNPYAGYKISGRFIAGVGWNQRFAYNNKARQFEPEDRIYGPRVFVDFKLAKGFVAHLEHEVMNTFVPNIFSANPDNGHREWVWSTMLGIKKQYKIYKNLNGTVLIQYNLHDRYHKAPYLDKLNSRMGFEYVLRKKKKK